ncbi:O-antigen ligase family protein [Thiohalophilus sp.]|uniref:O-antigen ligase family protein n=1 Tax=Thiohalophilus sp. TaxID=3028392 RepID=UPI002ACD4876|nr:O-antigen ligase family protein [Thiohalophilus sp.]MDZ7661023.1 O-antigen ligase family protein [Thiohalophilus sp.]
MESIAPSSTRIRQIGLAGLYVFAFSAFYDKAGGVLGLLLMLIAMGFCAREVWNDYKFDPMAWTVALFVLYLVLHAYTSALEFPQTSEAQWTEARNWGRLIVFLILAWWMRGEPRVIFWCLALALLGLFAKLLIDTEATDITRMLKSQRTGFAYTLGFSTIISAASIAAMLIFTPRVLKYPAPTAARALIILTWFAAIIVLIQIQITTAFRGTWLAIAVVIALAMLFLPRSLAKNLLLYSSLGIILILLIVQNSTLVQNRVHNEEKTISLLMEGASINEIPLRGSVGIRLHLWNYGLKRWLERPLFGWGPGTEITKRDCK